MIQTSQLAQPPSAHMTDTAPGLETTLRQVIHASRQDDILYIPAHDRKICMLTKQVPSFRVVSK